MVGESLREGRERPGPAERRLERIWLGLRTADGVPWDEVETAGREARIEAWRAEGWIVGDVDRLRLTPQGWLRLDPLAAEIAGWSREDAERTRRPTA